MSSYMGYSGFVGEAKNPILDGERLSIVGRHTTETPTGRADLMVLIKPGTSKTDALALLSQVAASIEAYGGWEHGPQSDNVVPFAPPEHSARQT